jgi:ribosomal protein L32
MSTGDAAASGANEVPLPKTVEELKEQAAALKRCSSCRQRQATHTVSVTLAKLGAGRGAVEFTVPRVPVCESCGSQAVGLAKRALKA